MPYTLLVTLAMHKSLLICPCGKGLREAVDSRTPQFRFARQVPMLWQHIAHQVNNIVTWLSFPVAFSVRESTG